MTLLHIKIGGRQQYAEVRVRYFQQEKGEQAKHSEQQSCAPPLSVDLSSIINAGKYILLLLLLLLLDRLGNSKTARPSLHPWLSYYHGCCPRLLLLWRLSCIFPVIWTHNFTHFTRIISAAKCCSAVRSNISNDGHTIAFCMILVPDTYICRDVVLDILAHHARSGGSWASAN